MKKNMEKSTLTEKKEMSVDEVKSAANEQISILYNKLQEANMMNAFKRLDYLFKLLEVNELKDKAIKEIDKMIFG